MHQQPGPSPYRPLGNKLKDLREKAKETLADASGAVEIDVRQLASYELGQKRPTEDILLLLISHFGARDEEAVKIWELAGYGAGRIPLVEAIVDELSIDAPAQEPQILFTDIVDVVVNNYGVVMNFMQAGSPGAQPASIAKVGMSREHAKSVLKILEVTLAQTERASNSAPKKLALPENFTPDENTTN